jgi:general secretion pathway protein D
MPDSTTTMTTSPEQHRRATALRSPAIASAVVACVTLFSAPAASQPARADQPAPPPPADAGDNPAPIDNDNGRRVSNERTTTLAFDNVTVERIVPFIVEATGKVVLPRSEIMSRRITIINDRPIPQSYAVDLVFYALQQEGIGVVETDELVILRDIAEIDRQDVPVLGPDDSTLGRTDFGAVAEKVYRLEYQTAENLEDVLDEAVPDFAKIAFDSVSNQVVVRGNISLLQRMERLLNALDQPSAASLRSRTFRLRFADAEQIAENIRELFEVDDASSRSQQQAVQRFFRGRRTGGDDQDSASTSENIRVTSNTQQNTVTVLAEPDVLDQVADLVATVWDQPLPDEAVIPRIYDLEHTDPVRIATLLEGLFGSGASGAAAGGGGQGQQGGAPVEAQGAGRLAGQFTFQPLAEAGRLVVVAKSPDNLSVIDAIIEDVDRPQTVGLPRVVPLKHADAEELAEQLNALLSQEGTLAQIPRQERGLQDLASNVSPFAPEEQQPDQQEDDTTELITFWWQRARPPEENRGSSNLVGRLRIVPVWRQNAVMVLSPPEYMTSVVNLIEDLDRPGRQVLITAVIAEVGLEDALSLGLRWGPDDFVLDNSDNAFVVGTETTAREDNLLNNLFDTSVLDASVDLNFVLQALDQNNSLNILSEPRIFTSDNQEAEFFDGQDVPIVEDVQLTDEGTRNTTRTYRAVGIRLAARPRITTDGNVDLRVNLELSSIAPGQAVDDFVIIDRRETTTQLIVNDGQTVVISGILRSEDTDVTRKVPLLGDIPLLGALFTSVEQRTINTELVAFITPSVVRSQSELNAVNEPFRQRLNQLRDRLEQDIEESDPEADLSPDESSP